MAFAFDQLVPAQKQDEAFSFDQLTPVEDEPPAKEFSFSQLKPVDGDKPRFSFADLKPIAQDADIRPFLSQAEPLIQSSPIAPQAPPAEGSTIVPDVSSVQNLPEPNLQPAPVPGGEMLIDQPIRIGAQAAQLPRFGEPGTRTRGVSEVISGIGEWAMNKPEELLASVWPPTSLAFLARYAPDMARQFAGDVAKSVAGDKEAQGRAISVAAMVGLPFGLKEAQKAKARIAQARVEGQLVNDSAIQNLSIRDTAAEVPQTFSERPDVLPLSKAALNEPTETTHASQIVEPTEIHGNLRSLQIEGEGEVPIDESGARVQLQTEGRIQETPNERQVIANDEAQRQKEGQEGLLGNKPAPLPTEQAPQAEAPTEPQVVSSPEPGAKPPGAAPDIAQTTTGVAEPQPEAAVRKTTNPKSRGAVERPWDIIDQIESSVGTIRNKKNSQPGSEGYYGDAYANVSKGPARHLFDKNGQSPDEVLDTLRRDGLLAQDATVYDLWDAIDKASGQRRAIFRGETPEIQADKFQSALEKQSQAKGSHFVSVGDLSVGDTFRIGGEEIEVTGIDPDTGEVSVKDGRKFGRQTIPDGADIPVEKGSYAQKAKTSAFGEDDFSLNTPESVEQQKARLAHEAELEKAKADREARSEGAAKPLAGSRGDIGQGDLLGGGDLFSGSGPKGPGLVGMGGAAPSEFGSPGGTPTALKNAAIDEYRVKRGLEPQMAPLRQTWGQAWDKAMAKVDQDPGFQDRLIAEIKEDPRPIEDWEHAALLQRYVDLKNEFERSARDAAQAYDDGRIEDLDAANARTAAWSNKLAEVEQVAGKGGAGTMLGRGLAARKMLLNDDFTLASLELQTRASRSGEPITPEERLQLKTIADNYAKENADLTRLLADKEKKLSETEAQRAFLELETQKAKTRTVSDYVLQTAKKWVKKWESEAAVARKNLAGKFLSPSPSDLLDLAKIVRFRIGEVGLDVAKITAELVSEFGEGVKPYVTGAIETAQKLIDKLGEQIPKEFRDQVKQTATKQTPTVETTSEKIGSTIQKGELDSLTPQVKKLAEIFYANDITKLDPMIDALQGVLKKFLPEITRQQTMDALSGRGTFTLPSQDSIKKGIRDLSTQARLVGHQIDVEAGRPLPRTGPQRDKMSDAARRELQKLEELKRKFGVKVTDPVAQLESALQAQKTYLSNRMVDLRQEISTRERIVKTKTEVKPDAELEAMRKEYEIVKAEHAAIFPRREITTEQRIAAANRSLDRAIANLESDLAAGKLFKDKTPSKTPSTPEIEAKRARLEALRSQRKELRDLDETIQSEKAQARLGSEKKTLEKQIAEQERKLSEGDLAGPGKPMNRPAHPELEPLKQRRDELNKQLAEARKKPETQKAAEQMARQLAAMNKRIAELDAQVASGVIPPKQSRPVNRPLPPELEVARQKLDELNKQIAELRKGPVKTPLERALQARKTRLDNQIAVLKEKVAKGDFSVKALKEPPVDAEITKKQFELEKIRKQFYEGLLAQKMANRPPVQKFFGGLLEAANTTRAVMTSMDLSAVLRQGKMIVLSHPIRAAQSIMPMLRAFRSPEKAFAVEQEIMARPNYPLYRQSKLFLSEHGQGLSQMEEAYMSRWAGKVPLVAGSQRAYTTFLNKLRADSFDAMASSLSRSGRLTPNEAKVIAHYINVSTGRGTFGLNEQAAVGLNSLFFAPRYVASRFQLLTGQPLWYGAASGKVPFRGTGAARRLIAGEYARILGGAAVVYALGLASGASIETDPRSSDFGKLRFGNTRIDPMAGLLQVSVLLSRLGTGETKTSKGKTESIRGKVKFGKSDASEIIGRFARTKLSPLAGSALDLASGKDYAGQPISPKDVALDLATPMTLNDIYKSMKEQGIPAGTALGILSIFGESIQNYDSNAKRK